MYASISLINLESGFSIFKMIGMQNNNDIHYVLKELTSKYPPLFCKLGDVSSYKRLRVLESHLVSCLDGESKEQQKTLQVLTMGMKGELFGGVSFMIFNNVHKKENTNLYVRVDLVIIDKKYRGLGLGRCLLLCAIVYILQTYGKRIYSISCLAAHKAIEVMLEQISFTGDRRDDKGFKHESIDLKVVGHAEYIQRLEYHCRNAIKESVKRLKEKNGF